VCVCVCVCVRERERERERERVFVIHTHGHLTYNRSHPNTHTNNCPTPRTLQAARRWFRPGVLKRADQERGCGQRSGVCKARARNDRTRICPPHKAVCKAHEDSEADIRYAVCVNVNVCVCVRVCGCVCFVCVCLRVRACVRDFWRIRECDAILFNAFFFFFGAPQGLTERLKMKTGIRRIKVILFKQKAVCVVKVGGCWEGVSVSSLRLSQKRKKRRRSLAMLHTRARYSICRRVCMSYAYVICRQTCVHISYCFNNICGRVCYMRAYLSLHIYVQYRNNISHNNNIQNMRAYLHVSPHNT